MTIADTLPTLGGMKRKAKAKRGKRNKPELAREGNAVVKIYHRTRPTLNGETRKVYEVADYSTGRRVLKSFTDHSAAVKEANRIARLLSTGEAAGAAMKGKEVASYGRAVELLRPTGTSLELAAARYAKAVEIIGSDLVVEAASYYVQHRADRIEKRRVPVVVEELLANRKSKGKSERYVADLRARLNRFAKDFQVDISTVTTPDVQRWLDKLKAGSQTVKNYRTTLFTLFKFAERNGYIPKRSNPVADTEPVEVNDDGPIEIYTPDELEKLLKAASEDFLPVVALPAFAGLRTGEVQRLDWVDINGEYVHVGRDKAKTRSRRLVPIQPSLTQWLKRCRKEAGPIWTGTNDSLRDCRAECVQRSGVQWKNNGLRHSFVSYRLAATQNAQQVALEVGHRSADVLFQHYRELVTAEAAKAWFSIQP